MRYFLDCEFATVEGMPTPRQPGSPGRGRGIIPISLAIVADNEEPPMFGPGADGEGYWTLEHDVERAQAAVPWLIDNVYPYLPPESEWLSRDAAREEVEAYFVRADAEWREPDDDRTELWAYWIGGQRDLFCLRSLFDEPPAWMASSRNLRTWANEVGFPSGLWPRVPERNHEALADAEWDYTFWHWIDRWETDAAGLLGGVGLPACCVKAAWWRARDSSLPKFGIVYPNEPLVVYAHRMTAEDDPRVVVREYASVEVLLADWVID